MNLSEIQTRIQEIEDHKWDPETAHALEDALYEDYTRYISEQPMEGLYADIIAMAQEILKTKNIHFERWCA